MERDSHSKFFPRNQLRRGCSCLKQSKLSVSLNSKRLWAI